MQNVIAGMQSILVAELSDITPAAVIVKGPVEIVQWPQFERYLIELLPGEKYQQATGEGNFYNIYYPVTIRVFVDRWNDDLSLYGEQANGLGIFMLLERIKTALNGTNVPSANPATHVWGGRRGGEATKSRVLRAVEIDRLSESRARLSSFYRAGEVPYEGQSKPQVQMPSTA